MEIQIVPIYLSYSHSNFRSDVLNFQAFLRHLPGCFRAALRSDHSSFSSSLLSARSPSYWQSHHLLQVRQTGALLKLFCQFYSSSPMFASSLLKQSPPWKLLLEAPAFLMLISADKDLLYNTGNCTQYLIITCNGREGNIHIGMCVCVYVYIYIYTHMLSCFSHVQLFATLWTIARQAPQSTGFCRQETGMGCHALLQGIFQTEGLNPHLLKLLQCRQIPCGWATGETPKTYTHIYNT